MALVDLPSPICYPDIPFIGASFGYSGTLQDAAGEFCGLIFQAQRSETITHVGFLSGTQTVAGTVDIRLETFDTGTGLNSGSLIAAGAEVNVNIPTANTFYEGAIGTPPSVTAGEKYCIVVRRNTYSGNIQRSSASQIANWPGPIVSTGTAQRTADVGVFSIKYGTSGYLPHKNAFPYSSTTSTRFDNGSTPDVYANEFALSQKVRAKGIWVGADFDADVNLNLYGTDGATVERTVLNSSVMPTITGFGWNFLDFDSPFVIEAGDTHFLGFEPASGTTTGLLRFVFPSSDIRAASFGGFRLASAKDPSGLGSWTAIPNEIILMGLIIDQIDDGAGGGAGGGGSIFGSTGGVIS